MLLQLLDDGRLTDGHGRTVDFRNTVVIMTSNIRSADDLTDRFRPEFLNRIDEIVVFDALNREQLGSIVEMQLARLNERLAERGHHARADRRRPRADRRGGLGSRLRRAAAQARDPAAAREPARARLLEGEFRRRRRGARVRGAGRDPVRPRRGRRAGRRGRRAGAGRRRARGAARAPRIRARTSSVVPGCGRAESARDRRRDAMRRTLVLGSAVAVTRRGSRRRACRWRRRRLRVRLRIHDDRGDRTATAGATPRRAGRAQPRETKTYSCRATLTPKSEVPAPNAPAKAAGVFTATVKDNGRSATVRWTLTFARLSGKAIAGAHPSSARPASPDRPCCRSAGPARPARTGAARSTHDQAEMLRSRAGATPRPYREEPGRARSAASSSSPDTR